MGKLDKIAQNFKEQIGIRNFGLTDYRFIVSTMVSRVIFCAENDGDWNNLV